jgi:solute carrier family 34 (sodium-dependent phosphate cotransporter)
MENFGLKKDENGKLPNEMEQDIKTLNKDIKNAHHLDFTGKKEIYYISGKYTECDKESNDRNEKNKSEMKYPEKEWYFYTKQEKTRFILTSVMKFIMFSILLYLFLLSLSFMSIGFTLVSRYALQAGDIIKFILSNPFAALSIGILLTALMQNATATTSIAVIMVGAGIIPDVKSAVPIIMGANIGTCVTNSFIALTLANDPNEFKRAFSAATLNDMFNLLTTSILLPLEIFSGFLFVISDKLTSLIPFENSASISQANFMAAILNPVTDAFFTLNSTAVDLLSSGNKNIKEVALKCCQTEIVIVYNNNTNLINETNSSLFDNMTISLYSNETRCLKECTYWCMPMLKSFGEGGTGLFWIILSVVVLISSLFGIVKVLSLLIVGPVAKGVRRALNASLPGKFKWFTQVILFMVAFGLTIIVQSSNIITATLVPLCGMGIISLQKVFVMTLGSNIGTTVTGILTAFTQPPSSLKKAMQLGFVYTFFNTLGVLFWLPIPILRFPKRLARKLGNIVFEYRWFLYFYVSIVYLIGPIFLFGLALIPYGIGIAFFEIFVVFIFLSYIILFFLRYKFPFILPKFLLDFTWLPLFLRSLKPFDEKIKSSICFRKKESNNLSKKDQLELTQVLRKMSVITPLVKEARKFSISNGSELNDSSSEEEYDTTVIKEQRRRMNSLRKIHPKLVSPRDLSVQEI